MNQKLKICILILLFACLSQASVDIYLPSIPAISSSFKVPLYLSQWTISLYLLGLSISLLFYGPISDAIGRKKPLLFGLAIAFIGTIICVLSVNIEMLLIGRLLQGVGSGACASLWRSVFRDAFDANEMSKYGSYLVLIFNFIVPAVPALGGFLQHLFGWRANFIALLIYVIIALISVGCFLPETNKHLDKSKLSPKIIKSSFKELLFSKVFIGNSLCTFLASGAIYAWVTSAPILLMKKANLPPIEFGLVFLISSIIPFAIAGYLNAKLVGKYGINNMLCVAYFFMGLAGVLLILLYFVFGFSILGIVLPIMLFYTGTSFLFPNTVAGAFKHVAHIAGVAGSLYAFLQQLGGTIFSGIMAHMPSSTPIPLAVFFIGVSLVSFVLYLSCIKE